jgi:hypothetical protein
MGVLPLHIALVRYPRRRDNFIAVLAQNGNGLRANQASAADRDYLHGLLFLVGRRTVATIAAIQKATMIQGEGATARAFQVLTDVRE